MLSTSIGPDLDKDENEIEKPEVKNVEEEQATLLEQLKFYEVKKYQASVSSNKNKNDKDGA